MHPKAQAAFGDFVFKSALLDNKNFIIETHSDYTIDRFRLKVNKYAKEQNERTVKSQIVFFKKNSLNNELVCLPIYENGTLPGNLPNEFRDFFVKEQLELIQI